MFHSLLRSSIIGGFRRERDRERRGEGGILGWRVGVERRREPRRIGEEVRFRSGGKRLASGPVPLPVSAFNSRWPVARPAKGHEASKGESNSFRDPLRPLS